MSIDEFLALLWWWFAPPTCPVLLGGTLQPSCDRGDAIEPARP